MAGSKSVTRRARAKKAAKVTRADDQDDQACRIGLGEASDTDLQRGHFVDRLVEDFLTSTLFNATRHEPYYQLSFRPHPYETKRAQNANKYTGRSSPPAPGTPTLIAYGRFPKVEATAARRAPVSKDADGAVESQMPSSIFSCELTNFENRNGTDENEPMFQFFDSPSVDFQERPLWLPDGLEAIPLTGLDDNHMYTPLTTTTRSEWDSLYTVEQPQLSSLDDDQINAPTSIILPEWDSLYTVEQPQPSSIDGDQMFALTSNSLPAWDLLYPAELLPLPSLEGLFDPENDPWPQATYLPPVKRPYAVAEPPDSTAPEASHPPKRRKVQFEQQRMGNHNKESQSSSHVDARPCFVDNELSQLLACPYQRWKPLTYHKCRNIVLRGVARVKQHLWRSHMIPIHCPLCFTEFRSEEDRDAHTRRQKCSKQEPKHWEGISREKQAILKRRVKASLSKEEQWYEMYEILFPGSLKPKSPYIDTSISGNVLALQGFMANEWKSTFDRLVQEKIPPALAQQEHLVKEFADSVLEEAFEVLCNRLGSDDSMRRTPCLADDRGDVEDSQVGNLE